MKNHVSRTKLFPFAGLALALAFVMAPAWGQRHTQRPPHYTFTDLGTLSGGNFSLAYDIDNRGRIDGFSTTTLSDGTVVTHAFVSHPGGLIDLGTLGGPNSQTFSGLNDEVQVPGESELSNQDLDPNGEDFCGFLTGLVCRGFLWQEGELTPLDTLGGNNSQAADVNDLGQVAGYAETSTPDPACPTPTSATPPPFNFPQVLHYRPVIWANGKIQAILPLYKDDAEGGAFWINNRGEVVGASGVCAFYDPRYGLPLQPEHALLWRNGEVTDLGNLGGKFNNSAFAINDLGVIVGASDLADREGNDTYQHAFLWHDGRMVDLGTLSGDVVSAAVGINNRNQATGVSIDSNGNLRGFLWQAGVMSDLNTLIPAVDSQRYSVLHGFGINDDGQIVGFAFDSVTGEVHAFLASPACDGDDTASIWQDAETGTKGAKVALPDSVHKQLQQYLRSHRFDASARRQK